jgi:hypothetical protein
VLEGRVAIEAAGFYFIGTFVHVHVNNEKYLRSMDGRLAEQGIACSYEDLMEAHNEATQKYWNIRRQDDKDNLF